MAGSVSNSAEHLRTLRRPIHFVTKLINHHANRRKLSKGAPKNPVRNPLCFLCYLLFKFSSDLLFSRYSAC